MKKIVLAVMDGVGYTKETVGNALYAANTPNLDSLFSPFIYNFAYFILLTAVLCEVDLHIDTMSVMIRGGLLDALAFVFSNENNNKVLV